MNGSWCHTTCKLLLAPKAQVIPKKNHHGSTLTPMPWNTLLQTPCSGLRWTKRTAYTWSHIIQSWRFLCFFLSYSLKASELLSVSTHEKEELLTLLESIQGSLQGTEKTDRALEEISTRCKCRIQWWQQSTSELESKSHTQEQRAQNRFIYCPYISRFSFISENNTVHLIWPYTFVLNTGCY